MKKKNPNRLPAFTLQELLVVLTIIGILTLLAIPTFKGLFGEAYSTEAKMHLKKIQEHQEMYRSTKFAYADNFQDIKYDLPTTVLEGGEGKFLYEITSAGKGGFVAQATAIEDFDGDGQLNVWEIDQSGQLNEIISD